MGTGDAAAFVATAAVALAADASHPFGQRCPASRTWLRSSTSVPPDDTSASPSAAHPLATSPASIHARAVQ